MRLGQEPQLHNIATHLLEAARMQLQAAEMLHQVTESAPASAETTLRPDRHVPDDHVLREEVDLTAREQEVLAQLGHGLTNRQLSRALGISTHTVRAHLQSIFRKLEVNHRTEALVHAARLGLLDVGRQTHEESPLAAPPPPAVESG